MPQTYTFASWNVNGLRAVLDGQPLCGGNADFLRTVAEISAPMQTQAEALSEAGKTPLFFARGGKLLGIIAVADVLKPDSPQAIRELRNMGIRVVMITGDNARTAKAIGAQAGVDEVIAGVLPDGKEREIRRLSARGKVAMVGDGINDAAAMKASDVGISVDSAVDIARESADIILLEKDLMVLEQGAIEGRRIYANIIKYIKMTASSNFGNMFSVLAASAFLPFLPLAPLQILVLNLIYDISCTAMPWDNVDADFLKQPKTWDASSISRFMIWFGPASSVFDITTFVLLYTYICPLVFGGAYETLDAGMQVAFVGLFQAGWFVESLWTQTLVLHMLRTPKVPFLRSRASWQVTGLTSLGILAGTCIPFTTVGGALDMMPLPGAFFPWLFATLAAYMLLTTTLKGIFIKKYGELL